jgi:hypothetical protein
MVIMAGEHSKTAKNDCHLKHRVDRPFITGNGMFIRGAVVWIVAQND